MNISSIGDNHNDGGERNLDSIISTINSKKPYCFVFFNDIYYILSHFLDIILMRRFKVKKLKEIFNRYFYGIQALIYLILIQ